MPEDKFNNQQNQPAHFLIGNQNFLIFRSQQIWGEIKLISVQLWLAVH